MTQAPPETHAGRTTLEVAVTARTMQLAIRARLLRDVTALWPALDKDRLGETFPGWVRAMSLLVRNYHGQSAAAASAAYREARAQATMSPAPRSLVKLAPAPSDEWMRQAFGFSGPGMLNKDTARPNTALSTTLGTASRIALDGGRMTTIETVKADPVAIGFYRVTDGAPCAFCALLASRGVVEKSTLYVSEHSFDASNAKFTGPGMAKVHNDCGCSMAPAFSRDQELPEVNRKAAEVYLNRGDHPNGALAAFRKAWAAHLASQSA